jgi:hypothetical protein
MLPTPPTDGSQLNFMTSQLPRKPKGFTADAAYAGEENIAYHKKRKIEAYIACGREEYTFSDDPPTMGRILDGLTMQGQMRRKIRTLKGQRLYAKRKAIVESVTGQIKHVIGLRQLNLHRHPKVSAEGS